jgi:hypothetical protein
LERSGESGDPSVHDAGGDICPDQLEEPFVLDPSGHPCHKHVMVDGVEELFQIHHKAVALFDILPGLPHRIVGAFARPEAVRRVAEVGIEEGGEHLQGCLLDETVEYDWYAEGADPFFRKASGYPPASPVGGRRPPRGVVP